MTIENTQPPCSDYELTSANRVAVNAILGHLDLPAPTLVASPDAVHVTVVDVDDLGRWVLALGGTVHQGPATDGAAVWTLHTATPARRDGATTAIRVHAVVVDGEEVLVEVRQAVANA